jgi:flagellin
LALSIMTNIGAISASKSISNVAQDLDRSMARLSSGSRINSATDDAAGLGTSSRLAAEASGFDQAAQNAAHAQAALGELTEKYASMQSVLQRLREISVQAANGINSPADIANINKEYDELVEEIDALATPISDGFTLNFQIGDAADETLTFSIAKISASDLSLQSSAAASLTSADAYTTHISVLDDAIQTVVERQTEIGANINRLDYTMAHFASHASRTKESLGSIHDTDFALETTRLAKSQTLHQSASAMLAQANVSKETILALVSG